MNRTTFRGVLSVEEFRALWSAELLSVTGDQFARVALVVLVFDRTGSAAMAGLTYALTFVPALAGTLALSQVADQRPRRQVVVFVDGLRALVVAVMVIPGVDLLWQCVLVSVLSFVGGPYSAAQLALLRDLLSEEQYSVGMSLRQITVQAAQLAGVATGGLLSTAVSPQFCLAVNAFTFAASALLLGKRIRSRPAPAPASSSGRFVADGVTLVWSDPRRRAIFVMTFLGVCYVVPEGIAVAYVSEMGHGAVVVGLVLASCNAGAVIGLPIFVRFVTPDRQRVALAVVCVAVGIPLVPIALVDGIFVAMVAFAVSGALWAALVVMSASFLAELLPDASRSRGMGLASSANVAAQGMGIGVSGLVAEVVNPSWVIAIAGAVSVPLALWPSLSWLRSTAPPR